MAELKKFVLKKSEWLCPEHENWDHDSGLCVKIYDPEGERDDWGDIFFDDGNVIATPMCCLGVVAHKLGAEKECLFNMGFPSELGVDLPDNYPDSLVTSESYIADVNDSVNINRKERIKQLTPYFKEAGYKLVYVDDSK